MREPIVTDDAIKGFFGPYRFLSNFQVADCIFDGKVYPSTENAFQAAKFPQDVRVIFQNLSCMEAKKHGQSAKIERAVWEATKVQVMHDVLISKFYGHRELGNRLLLTGKKKLVELNDWGDRYWGAEIVEGQEIGLNMLGLLLEAVRNSLEISRTAIQEMTQIATTAQDRWK